MPTEESSYEILHSICDSFRPYVQELWKDLSFGLCRSKVEIEKLCSSSGNQNSLADNFTLVLPYAGEFLKWEVLFDAARPWFAPDFRFDDCFFLSNVDAEFVEKNIPSLANWNTNDPKALSHVITELMHLYREHQKKLLSEDEASRAYFEYTTLIGDSLTPENDIEILVGQGDTVNFMIKLNIEHARLPILFPNDSYENPGGECAVLLVKYPNPAKADLIMSPLVMRAVGNVSLPPIPSTSVLMDYVPHVTKLINGRIETVFQNEKMKHKLLSHFIVKYESCVIEHDSSSASFLFNVKNFYCILCIEIGVNFPEKLPVLTLRSVYHMYNRRPCMKVLAECPYEDIELYLVREIEIFKEECENAIINSDESL